MDERLQAEICARIKQARTESGMTLEEMADALGVTTRAYWNYENNRVPFRRLRDIAELTGTTQGWLLHGQPDGQDAETLKQILERVNEFTAEGSRSAMEALRFLQDRMSAGVQMTEENQTLLAALADAVARLERGQVSILEELERLAQLAERRQPPGEPQAQPSNGG